MKIEQTQRGFGIVRFKDAYGIDCTIQESSIMAEEGHIWLGTQTDNKIKVMSRRGQPMGWRDVDLRTVFPDSDIVINDRMHLTQSQVKDMLPYLTYFAEHGHLPNE